MTQVGIAVFLAAASVSARPEPAVVTIVIDKAAFEPLKKPLLVGDVVEWVNNDVVDHTATENTKATKGTEGAKDAKGWDVVVRVGRKARVEMKKPGKIDYICRFHPNMTGTIEVRAK